jgi:rubrerythrin
MAAVKKYPGVVIRKRHGTAMGVAGDPDLYGSVNGRHFELEVKRPNDRFSQLTKLQTQRLQEWKIQGKAITGVVRSVEDALVILGLKRPSASVWVCMGCRAYRWQSDEPPARCPNCLHIRFEREAA